MTAQTARLLISLSTMALAGAAWLLLAPPWVALSAAGLIIMAGGALAEAAFRRLASAEEKRADLKDRVRNPPL